MGFPGTVELTSEEVLRESASKDHPLGTRGQMIDGRVYRYSYSGEALDVGIPVTIQAPLELSYASVMAGAINDTADTSEISTTWSALQISTTWTTCTVAADELADGYLFVASSTDALAMGQLIRIKSNTAGTTDSAVADPYTIVTFKDDSRLSYLATTGDAVCLMANEFYKVIEHDGAEVQTGGIVGVPNRAVTSGRYFWAQTWGPCPVLADGTWALGDRVVSSSASDQGLQAPTMFETTGDTYLVDEADTWMATAKAALLAPSMCARPDIGWVLVGVVSDNKYGLVFLTIMP